MNKVTKLIVTPVRVPLEHAVAAPGLEIKFRDYILVQLECDDGSRGVGFSYVGTGGGSAAAMAAEELLVPIVRGQDPNEVERLWNAMYQGTRLQGRSGLVMNGLGAIDIALWDRNSRAAGLPLYRYLGATDIDSVPAYASGGYYAQGKGAEELAGEISGYVRQGFNAVKIKTGQLGIKEEEKRVGTVRDILGDDRLLMLDIYGRWADYDTAVDYVEMYKEFNPYWIEDPFEPDDIENYTMLAANISIPVATGEFYSNEWVFKSVIDAGAAAILQPEAPRCGGISGWRRIASLASKKGLSICPVWFHDLHAHLVASHSNALFVEYFADYKVLNFGKLIDRQLQVNRNCIMLPEKPGLGFDFLEDVVDQYTLHS